MRNTDQNHSGKFPYLRRWWENFKNKPEYITGAFPFPPRKASVFDKLHNRFIGAVMLVGTLWLMAKFVGYAIEQFA